MRDAGGWFWYKSQFYYGFDNGENLDATSNRSKYLRG